MLSLNAVIHGRYRILDHIISAIMYPKEAWKIRLVRSHLICERKKLSISPILFSCLEYRLWCVRCMVSLILPCLYFELSITFFSVSRPLQSWLKRPFVP